jgi:hypothetical protein
VSRARRASARSPVSLSRCRCSCRAGPGSIGAPATEIDDHVACFPRKRPLCQGDHETAAASWLRRASGDRSKKTANRTAVARGPSAGPKPESMMVPRGARRSDQKAHPSRLEQARRFLPSWSRIRQMAHRNRENSRESQWALSVSPYPVQPCRRMACAPCAAATSISAPMRRHHPPAGRFPVRDAGRARVARQASVA